MHSRVRDHQDRGCHTVTKFEIAYLTGIVDSEGHIGLNKYKNHMDVRLDIGMTSEETIKYIHKLAKCGSVYLYIPKNIRHKPRWSFIASGIDAANIINIIRFYLITKLAQANVVLEFQEKCIFNAYKGSNKPVPIETRALGEVLSNELLALNLKGPKNNSIEINHKITEWRKTQEPELWAYVAAAIDGDGCIRLKRDLGNSIYTVINFYSSYKTTLDAVQKIIGFGRICFNENSNPRCKNLGQYTASGKEALLLLKEIVNFSITKKEQIKLALEFAAKCANKIHKQIPDEIILLRNQMADQMDLLNKRGL